MRSSLTLKGITLLLSPTSPGGTQPLHNRPHEPRSDPKPKRDADYQSKHHPGSATAGVTNALFFTLLDEVDTRPGTK